MVNILRVLIVEDQPADAELMVLRLTNDGYHLDWQRVQTEAAFLSALETNPDVILSDWSLPQFSGLRALSLIQERGLDTPFIIISGSIGEEAAVSALRRGAYDYILKDRPDRLGQAVQHALEQKKLRAERMRAEEALQREQYLMRTLLDTVPDVIYFKDTQSRFIRVNPAHARKLGAARPEELIGKNDADFFGPDHAQSAYDDEQQIIQSGNPLINIEELETYHDREPGWVSTTKMPLRDQNGEIVGTFGISRDITERKLAEKQLLETQRFSQATIDALTAHICVLDETGTILAVNRAWRNFADANPPAAKHHWLGSNYLEVCEKAAGPGSAEAAAFSQGLREIMRGSQETFTLEYPCHVPEGEKRWFIARVTRFSGEGPLRIVVAHENVTELKLAENALKESEEQYRSVSETANDAIITSDSSGIIVAWNPAAQRIFGYSAAEMIGQPVTRLIPERHLEAHQKGLELVNAGGESRMAGKMMELSGITREGRQFPIEVSLAHWVSAQRKFYTATIRDITARKLTEEALEREHYLMRILIDSIPDTIYFKDAQGHFLRINRAQAKRLGIAHPDEALGKTDFEFFSPEHALAAAKDENEIMQTGQSLVNYEELLTYPDRPPEWVSVTKMPLLDPNGAILGTFGISRDITNQKRVENSLRESEERYRKLVEESHEIIFSHDLELNILSMNPAMEKLVGIPLDRIKGMNLFAITPINEHKNFGAYINAVCKQGITSGHKSILTRENDERILEFQSTLIDQQGQIPVVRCMAQDITEKVQREQELEAIAAMSSALRTPALNEEILPIVLQEVNRLVGVDGSAISLMDSETAMAVVKLSHGDWKSWFGGSQLASHGVLGQVFHSHRPLIEENVFFRKASDWPGPLGEIQTVVCLPLIANSQLIGAMWLGRKGTFNKRDIRVLTTLSDISANAISKSTLYKQVEDRAATLASLYDAGLALNSVLEPHTQLEILFKIAMGELHAERMVFLRYIPSSSSFNAELCLGFEERLQSAIYQNRFSADLPETPTGWVRINELPLSNPDIAGNTRFSLGDPGVRSVLMVPVKHGNNVLGILGAMSTEANAFNLNQERLLVLFANQTAVALENASLLTETRLQVERLKSLHSIDETINTSLDLDITTSVLLREITNQLKVGAAAILLFDPATQALRRINGYGFDANTLRLPDFQSDQGLASRVANSRQMLHVSDLETNSEILGHSPFIQNEHFVEYYGLPLVSKGSVKGILEIYNRSRLATDDTWLGFMRTLAGQAAIAIDNIEMFENLKRSNNELRLAYDATIEGWSQAMDLRDKETEDHTRRVTDMTLRLAKSFGFDEDALVHIRRGALLHDIGKLGVPDEILLKAGPLDADEWAVMKKHPEYAYQMLAPIEYLRPALDIPYCHHEKWDGAGYPRGLKGEEIPLAARIFAIVDVWDALISNRPYRPAWTREKTLAHINELSGKQFDPAIVKAFFDFEINLA